MSKAKKRKSRSKPYIVVIGSAGCKTCKQGRQWAIECPDGVLPGRFFDDKDDAEWWAQLLNGLEWGEQAAKLCQK